MSKIDNSKPSYEAAYKRLRVDFITRLKGSVESIDNVVTQRQLAPLRLDDLIRAQRLAHNLSGSGTTFGFPAVTEKARVIDIFLDGITKILPEGQILDEENYKKLEDMLLELREVCANAVNEEERGKKDTGMFPLKEQKSAKVLKNGFHVLVVDDDVHLLELISMKLQIKGFRVSTAKNGDAAMRILLKEIPDLIILDIMMPGITGHEVLRRIKQDPGFVSIPVIMLTAQTQRQDVVNALHSGAIDYIVKPVNVEKLAARVEKTLDAGRFTVMLVDNDHLILQLLHGKYKESGFKVLDTDDGEKAWEQISKKLPDLVVLDRMLPGMDGIEILKRMRKTESTKNIPVIILSAKGEDHDIQHAMRAGAQDYVVKPFFTDNLLNLSLKRIKESSDKNMIFES